MHPILSPIQCQAARVMLKWGQAELAKRAGLHVQTICLFETEQSTPTKTTLEKIIKTLEAGGIEFLPNGGVQPKTTPLTTYEGTEGFRRFMDDVYEVAKEQGGEFCVYNVDERNFIKWQGKNWYKSHSERMSQISKDISFKILIREEDTYFLAENYAQYRWVKAEDWNYHSQYAYGDKLALIDFQEDTVEVVVLNKKELADGMRAMFKASWKQAIEIPENKKVS